MEVEAPSRPEKPALPKESAVEEVEAGGGTWQASWLPLDPWEHLISLGNTQTEQELNPGGWG